MATSQADQMVNDLADQVWNAVFQILDSHEFLNGEEAGAMAQSAADSIKQHLTELWS